MSDIHAGNLAFLAPFRHAQINWNDADIRVALMNIVDADAVFHLAHPFGDMVGAEAFYDHALAVLKAAWPDVERRDWIVWLAMTSRGVIGLAAAATSSALLSRHFWIFRQPVI